MDIPSPAIAEPFYAIECSGNEITLLPPSTRAAVLIRNHANVSDGRRATNVYSDSRG